MTWLMIVCLSYVNQNTCSYNGSITALMVYPEQCKAALDNAFNEGKLVICYDAAGNKFTSVKISK